MTSELSPWHLSSAKRVAVVCLALLSSGCFEAPCEVATEPGAPPQPCLAPPSQNAGRDAGADAGRRDAGVDAGVRDAGAIDAGRLDSGVVDSGVRDAGVDAGMPPVFDGGVTTVTDAGVRVIDFGTVTTNDAGVSIDFTFDVVAADEGFQVEATNRGPPLSEVQVDALRNPRNTTLALGRDFRQHLSRSRPDMDVQATVALESDDSRAEFLPGAWRFRVVTRDSRGRPRGGVPVAVAVFVKPRPPAGATQRLALNLFFSGSAGLTAATAPSQPRLQQGMRFFRDLAADAGVVLETPRLFDLPPGFSAITSMYEDAGSTMGRSAQALWRQSAVAPLGMNLFFVESISIDPRLPPGAVLGVAGGVPGPTMTQGTPSSGVMVLFDVATFVPQRPGEVDPLGITLAHEVGHQLGLSHVYETGGGEDNLSDTPIEGQPGADQNLMAPYATNLGFLSPLQKTSLRRNPVVRP